MTEELRERLEKLRLELGGVEIPQMRGDNLAITLATFFDDPYEFDDEDERGWGPSALKGSDGTLDAIHAHYAPLVSEVERLEAENERLMEAVRDWAAKLEAAKSMGEDDTADLFAAEEELSRAYAALQETE